MNSKIKVAFDILLVEDNSDDVFLTELALKKSFTSCKLTVAKNGQFALDLLYELIRENKKLPDLILLDINLPMLNGLEVLKEIKSDKVAKQIPTVIFTNSDSRTDMTFCYNHGADLFIRKPNNINEFRRIMSYIKEQCFSQADKLPTGCP